MSADLELALQEEVYRLSDELNKLRMEVAHLRLFRKECVSVLEDSVAAVMAANRMAASSARLVKHFNGSLERNPRCPTCTRQQNLDGTFFTKETVRPSL